MNEVKNLDSNPSQTRTERVDFSANAPVYDRRHGPLAPDTIVSQMLDVTGLPLGSRILDIDVGTGRADHVRAVRLFCVAECLLRRYWVMGPRILCLRRLGAGLLLIPKQP